MPLLGACLRSCGFCWHWRQAFSNMDGLGLRHRHVVGRKAMITVKYRQDKSFRLQVDLSGTIGDIIALVEKKMGIPKRVLLLTFNREPQLEYERTQAERGIQAGSTLQVLLLKLSRLQTANTEDHHGMDMPLPGHIRHLIEQKKAKIIVQFLDFTYLPLEVDLSETIWDVKGSIKMITGTSRGKQRIIFCGQQCEDGRSIQDYAIHDGSIVFLVYRLRGGGPLQDLFSEDEEMQISDDEEVQVQSSEQPSKIHQIMESCRTTWTSLRQQLNQRKQVIIDCMVTPAGQLEKQKKRWSNYSQKTLLFAVAIYFAHLIQSTSASPFNFSIQNVIAVLVIVNNAALSVKQPKWGNALVYISWFLLELVACLMIISFNGYYAFAILIVLSLMVAAALIQRKWQHTGNQQDISDEDNEYLDHLFELSQGIANCGGLITAASGHYMVGPVKAIGFFFFCTITLALYLMMVITVRVVARPHATCLIIMLMSLLTSTIIGVSIQVVRGSGRSK